MIRSLIRLASVALLVSAPAGWLHAGEPAAADKHQFIDTICAGVEKADRCLNAARLVIDRSLNWIMFEGCSAAGERDVVVKCFDRASAVAGALTGDPRYLENRQRCNRFDGEHVDEAKLLCYRSGFKYRNYYAERYGHLWDYADTK